MTDDLDAIRARHVIESRPSLPFCVACGQPWGENGCDARQLADYLDHLEEPLAEALHARYRGAIGTWRTEAAAIVKRLRGEG